MLGTGGLEHQIQDNVKAKVAIYFDSDTSLAYTIGRFANDTTSDVRSYLRNAAGQPVFAGGPFNINGYAYASIPASTFSNNVYDVQEEQWMQSLVFQRNSGGAFDWRIVASQYDYDEDACSACPRRRCPPGSPAEPDRSRVPMAPAGGRLTRRGFGGRTVSLRRTK